MKLLNTELRDIDFTDADDLEKFENAVEEAQKKLDKVNPDSLKPSEAIRKSCKAVFECLNKIFGDGTAEKVFGNKTSLRVCMQAFNELKEERLKQESELDEAVKLLNNDYNPNRAQRRAKK